MDEAISLNPFEKSAGYLNRPTAAMKDCCLFERRK